MKTLDQYGTVLFDEHSAREAGPLEVIIVAVDDGVSPDLVGHVCKWPGDLFKCPHCGELMAASITFKRYGQEIDTLPFKLSQLAATPHTDAILMRYESELAPN